MLVASRSCLDRLRSARWNVQSASMHLGRATAAATQAFLQRGEGPSRAVALLRVGADDAPLHVSRRGVGSPHFWAKDVPRIDASKHAVSSFRSNFVQVVIVLRGSVCRACR